MTKLIKDLRDQGLLSNNERSATLGDLQVGDFLKAIEQGKSSEKILNSVLIKSAFVALKEEIALRQYEAHLNPFNGPGAAFTLAAIIGTSPLYLGYSRAALGLGLIIVACMAGFHLLDIFERKTAKKSAQRQLPALLDREQQFLAVVGKHDTELAAGLTTIELETPRNSDAAWFLNKKVLERSATMKPA